MPLQDLVNILPVVSSFGIVDVVGLKLKTLTVSENTFLRNLRNLQFRNNRVIIVDFQGENSDSRFYPLKLIKANCNPKHI